MRVGELYSVIALVLAKHFDAAPDIGDAMKFRKSQKWLVQRNSEPSVKGSEHYAKFLAGESVAIISDDFISLNKFFKVSYYIEGSKNDLSRFYAACKFSPKFGTTDSLANQLLFVASLLKYKLDEKTHEFLLSFLTKYFLPYATIVSKDIIKYAQSEFYISFGYFLDDFCLALCEIFSIKKQ